MDVGLEYETGFETRRGARRGKVTVLPYGGAWAALVEPPDAPLPAEAAPAAAAAAKWRRHPTAAPCMPIGGSGDGVPAGAHAHLQAEPPAAGRPSPPSEEQRSAKSGAAERRARRAAAAAACPPERMRT